MVKESEAVQFSRLNTLMDNLDIPWFLVDGRHYVERTSDDGRYIVQ